MGEKEYKEKLRVAGAMDLYGLDRETAERLSKDVKDLLKQEEERILDSIEKVDTILHDSAGTCPFCKKKLITYQNQKEE